MTLAPLPLPLLVDHTFDLVSDTLVNIYHFNAAGRVTAILGEKNGPVAAPLLDYRVVSDDSVEILHGNERIERWSRIRVEDGLLHVERDGQPQTFAMTKPEQ